MRRALVIGAAGGVGLATAKKLISEGYSVIGSVLNRAQLDELRAECPAIEAAFILDVSNADGMAGAIRGQVGDGPLDAAVMCIGIAPFGPIETTSLSALRRTLEINTVADVALFQAAMPYLRQSQGRIVFISSVAGKISFPFVGHYSASKFALEALADAMRREVRKWGVKVSLVEPGGIRSHMATDVLSAIETACAGLSGPDKDMYADLFEAHRSAIKSLGSVGMAPEAVADTIWSALSDANPRTRYEVGPDCIQFCEMARTMSDEEIDAVASIADTVTVLEK